MPGVPTIEVVCDEWIGCYKSGWKGLICDEAFAHPAKYARNLIERIYAHVIAEGWVSAGDRVIDPFGGVALGGCDAMRHGLHWTGCELEAKFHALGNQNIALWNERFSRMPNWGTAVLLQGDSRQLSSVLDKAELTVSSPPYVGSINQNEQANNHDARAERKAASGVDMSKSVNRGGPNSVLNRDQKYGNDPAQLGAMKKGDLQATLSISSPPYVSGGHHPDQTGAWGGQAQANTKDQAGYGGADGQMGRMKEGDLNLAISSPPYASGEKGHPSLGSVNNDDWGNDGRDITRRRGKTGEYGKTEGQLADMPNGDVNLVISSPPYASIRQDGRGIAAEVKDNKGFRSYSGEPVGAWPTQRDQNNLGNMPDRDRDFQAAVSSPPYEGNEQHSRPSAKDSEMFKGRTIGEHGCAAYGEGQDNLGNQRGEDFWSASRLILEQLYQVITPGGHAVFVVKAFVRNKKIVDFPAQWAQLCEAVGFRLLHDHHAMLTESKAKQPAMDEFDVQGDTWRLVTRDKDHSVARKSFFRRLAESKGSPKIDYENILCFERPCE